MRNIKFRAWHKKHNEVYDVISLKFDYDGILEQAVVADKSFHWGEMKNEAEAMKALKVTMDFLSNIK